SDEEMQPGVTLSRDGQRTYEIERMLHFDELSTEENHDGIVADSPASSPVPSKGLDAGRLRRETIVVDAVRCVEDPFRGHATVYVDPPVRSPNGEERCVARQEGSIGPSPPSRPWPERAGFTAQDAGNAPSARCPEGLLSGKDAPPVNDDGIETP